MDSKFWNDKNKNIYNFFSQNIDRLYVVNELFPKIGEHFKNSEKILNIGIEDYNIYDKHFLKNDNLLFYGLDKDEKILPDGWKEIFKVDLTAKMTKKLPIFDAIIDYGVIGWPGVNKNLEKSQILQYIINITNLLKKGGLYFLKIDYKGSEHKNDILLEILSEFFITSNFYNLYEKKLIQNDDIYYDTYVFELA